MAYIRDVEVTIELKFITPELFKILTGESMNRDVDLDEWLDGIGFHPADSEPKQLGHEIARQLVALLGRHMSQLLPPGRDKSLVFTGLEDVLMRANRALALGGGPHRYDSTASLAGFLEDLREIADQVDAKLPEDPRVEEYKADQRARTERPDELETNGPEYYRLEAEARLAHRAGDELGDSSFSDEQIRAEMNAWLRYREALARGLSDREAREEGWPTARPVDDVPLPEDDEDEDVPTWRTTVTAHGTARWVVNLEARPGVVDLATVCRDPRNVAEACQEFLAGHDANPDGPFNGFHVQMVSLEHVNTVLTEIAKAGQRAFGAEAVEPL